MLTGFGAPALAELDDSATYTDKLHLKNGDTITGDLKQLDRGKLRFKTRTMDTVYVNWIDIASIESNKYLRIEKTDGRFNYGVIKKSDLSDNLIILDRAEEVAVPILSVATIQPIRVKQSFWRRLEGDVSGGRKSTNSNSPQTGMRPRVRRTTIHHARNWALRIRDFSRTAGSGRRRAGSSATRSLASTCEHLWAQPSAGTWFSARRSVSS